MDDEILPRLDTGKNYKYPDMPVIPATQAVQPVQKPRSILKCLKQYRPSWLWYHREVRFVDFPNRTTCSVIAGQSSVTTVTGMLFNWQQLFISQNNEHKNWKQTGIKLYKLLIKIIIRKGLQRFISILNEGSQPYSFTWHRRVN